jgi:hypothetical protein
MVRRKRRMNEKIIWNKESHQGGKVQQNAIGVDYL